MNGNSNTNTNSKSSELSFDEAPASWNTRYLSPEGFECQITLRGENGSELLEKATLAIAHLLEHGCMPYVYRSAPRQAASTSDEAKQGTHGSNGTNGSSGTNGTEASPSWCPIHQCEMKKWERDGRVWYSHKANGEWCRGK